MKRVQFPPDFFAHKHGRRVIVLYLNMAAVTSCENDLSGRVRVSGRKNVLRNLLRILYRRLKAGFPVCWLCSTVCLFVTERVLTKTEWNAQGVNVCYSKSRFTFVWFCFSSLENYFGLGTTNVKGKTDHSVSLRWNKEFWTFPKRRVFFWLFIRFICELISPSFAGLN